MWNYSHCSRVRREGLPLGQMQKRWTSIILSLEEKYCSVCNPVSAMAWGEGREGGKKILERGKFTTSLTNHCLKFKKKQQKYQTYCSPPCRSFQVLIFPLFHITLLLHPSLTSSSQEASQGRGDLLWPAWRAKELPLIDLVCFLPKLLFCSSCHEDAPVRRMCPKRSMTS